MRSTGVPVQHGTTADLAAVLEEWLATTTEGTACLVGLTGFEGCDRVRSLTPELVKGLEFDLVVLHAPASFGEGVPGAVDRYVAMTRATQRLVLLSEPSSPGSRARSCDPGSPR